jgi:hypothetical protein
MILGDKPLISEVVLSQLVIIARSGSNTHESTYNYYSSLIRWQANLCVPLYNYGIASMKVCCDFGMSALFCCL